MAIASPNRVGPNSASNLEHSNAVVSCNPRHQCDGRKYNRRKIGDIQATSVAEGKE
ncbi:hypothetical protein B0H12DRAFT_380099 [Mycena haematopus]|nr:hypothetical protein B0H12DRAFT_380099 [Mycena haematopus]